MKTMISAMNRTVQLDRTPKQISGTTQPVPPGTNSDITTVVADVDTDADENAAEIQEDTLTSTRLKRGEGPKSDRNAGLKLVADLDLMPEGKEFLKDFVTAKNPGTAEEQVLLFVYYMTHTLSVSPITPDHVLSCFKPAGKKVPVDLRQTIRNVAKNKAWLNTDLDDLHVTTQGENHVEHTLGTPLRSDAVKG